MRTTRLSVLSCAMNMLYTSTETFGMRDGAVGVYWSYKPSLLLIVQLFGSFYRYRNYEMACAALMDQTEQPLYFPLLDSPIPPGVRNLQRWVEAAWNDGRFSQNL
jgi:hypothetical protein